MSKSTGIVLTATGITFANEFANNGKINFRVPIAGLGVAFLFDGIERLNTKAGVGLAWIMLITVMVTPFSGKTPLQTLGLIASSSGTTPANATILPPGTGAIIRKPN